MENIQKTINELSSFDREKISDGYHTFKELYEFRMLYNSIAFNELYKSKKYDVHKSWKHYDGEKCFGGGWFVVVAKLPTGLITNHYSAEYWNLFKVEECEKSKFEYDGHTSGDVINRIKEFIVENYE